MRFKVGSAVAFLREQPSETSTIKRPLPPRTPLGECTLSSDGQWLRVDLSSEDEDKGFVQKSTCEEVDGGDSPTVARRGVVQKCVLAEVRFNEDPAIDPWFVSADFLIARSIIETKVTNADALIPGSDAIGPLQVSTREWRDFISNGGNLAAGFNDDDRDDPIRQIDGAAFRIHQDLKALSALRTPAAVGSDAFAPQFLDLFLAYLTESPAAALALRDAHENSANRSQPVTKFLRGPLTDEEVKALHKARSRHFGEEANPKSLNDVVTGVESELDSALTQAFEDIKQFIPEAVPVISVPEAGGGGTTFTEMAPRIMQKLMADFGFKDFQAAGILGNLGHETGGFTLFQELHPRSGQGGFGWAQWTGERRDDFEDFCQKKGFTTTSFDGNYGFLKFELQGTMDKVVDLLKATTTLEKAVEVFEQEFEKAGVVAMKSRNMWALRAMNAFTATGTSGTGGTASAAVAQKLREQIAAGKIKFDSATLEGQLLGLSTGTKVTAKLQFLVLKLSELANLRVSSLVRSGTGSHHTEGRAVDIGNQEIAGALLPMIATDAQVAALGIDELIFNARIAGEADPNKWNYDQGRKHPFDPATISDHGNHIHFAVVA